jgi:hypothetical protein
MAAVHIFSGLLHTAASNQFATVGNQLTRAKIFPGVSAMCLPPPLRHIPQFQTAEPAFSERFTAIQL